MSPIESRIEIACPAEEVFAYATDPARFSEWQGDVVRAHGEVGQNREMGSRFTTVRRMGWREGVMVQEITKSVPPTRWAARGVDGPVRPSVDMTIEPLANNTRSRITVVMDFEGHGIGKLLVPLIVRPLATKRAPQSYQRLKEQLEGRADSR